MENFLHKVEWNNGPHYSTSFQLSVGLVPSLSLHFIFLLEYFKEIMNFVSFYHLPVNASTFI